MSLSLKKILLRKIVSYNNKINFIYVYLSNLKYLPSWIILLLDLFLVGFSTILTLYFFVQLGNDFLKTHLFIGFSTILFIYFISFLLFKTFTGIIRHSTLLDIVKILFATIFSMITLGIINLISQEYYMKMYSFQGIFILSLFVFTTMFFFRLIIKDLFDRYFLGISKSKQEKVFILGTGNKAISLARALIIERPKRFKVCAFIDAQNQEKGIKTVYNIPILVLKRSLLQTIIKYNVKSIIICDDSIGNIELNKLVNECIDYGIKIYSSPLVENISKGNISSKIKSFKIQDLLNRQPIQLNFEKNQKIIFNKTILISGAAGSIGSEIVRQLLEFKPKKLILLDIAESPLHDLTLEINIKKGDIIIEPILCDVSNKNFLENYFIKYKPEIIYHAAAYKHVPLMEDNPTQAFLTNVMGSKNMADLAVKYHVNNFVMVSTDKAVNPSNVMGASKRMAELYIKSLSQSYKNQKENFVKFTITRFGNVLGSNGSVVPLFKKQINKGGPITITHPEITRYFMTIPEACQLVIEAGNMGNGGEIYVFDMGEPVKIVDLAKRMIKLAGYELDKDIKIKFVGLRPGEKLYEELITDEAVTLPTHHQKIMIMKEEFVDYELINSSILNITDDLLKMNHKEVVKNLKNIIPEFVSMNSIYENLDQTNKLNKIIE